MRLTTLTIRTPRAIGCMAILAFLHIEANAIQFVVSSLPGDTLTIKPSPSDPNYAEFGFNTSTGSYPAFFKVDAVIGGVGGTGNAVGTIFHGGITSQVWDPKPLGGSDPSLEQGYFGEYANLFVIDDRGNQAPLSFGQGYSPFGDSQFLNSFQYDSHSILRFGFYEGRTSGAPGIVFGDPDLDAFFHGNWFTIEFEMTVSPSRSLSDLVQHGGSGPFRAIVTSIQLGDSGVSSLWLGLSLATLIARKQWRTSTPENNAHHRL